MTDTALAGTLLWMVTENHERILSRRLYFDRMMFESLSGKAAKDEVALQNREAISWAEFYLFQGVDQPPHVRRIMAWHFHRIGGSLLADDPFPRLFDAVAPTRRLA